MMERDRWEQIERLYHAALEHEPEARETFLDEVCAGDEALRLEVAELLAYDIPSDSFIQSPAIEIAARAMTADPLIEASTRPKESLMAGAQIGAYQLLSPLGRGGMGEVHLALDARLGRKVALKLLPAEYTTDAERVQRFAREARAASALNHPNIITIHEIGEDAREHGSLRYIVTEYVEGETLRQRLAGAPQQRMELPEAIAIALQIASALTAAHEAGITHRDIKPENVMVRPDGLVKVLDFGLAKLTAPPPDTVDADASTMAKEMRTTPGMILGTVRYLSPEAARGKEVDAHTDQWSLGVLLFETLTGQHPFRGETASDVIAAILERPAPPLKAFIPQAPKPLQSILDKALAKEPRARYRNVRELHADLKRLEEEIAFAEKLRASASGRLLQTSKRWMAAAQSSSVVRSLRRELPVGAALLALVALITAVLFFWPTPPAEAPFSRIAMTDFLGRSDITEAVISPDGKFVVYLAEGRDGQRLGLKSVETFEDRQAPLPAPGFYRHLTISPDGRMLYYSIFDEAARGDLYSAPLPVAAGAPQLTGARKLIENVDTPISLSPDGLQFAFIRQRQLSPSELVVARLDGGDERVILRDSQLVIGGVAWSPKDETLACALREAGNEDYQVVVRVSLKDGAWTRLSRGRWKRIDRLAWFADGHGLAIAAMEEKSTLSGLWYVSYPDGEASRITSEVDECRTVSLTTDSAIIAVVRSRRLAQVWATDKLGAEPGSKVNATFSARRELTSGKNEGVYGLAWAPDGHIVYTSTAKGSRDLWVMNRDGGSKRPLTQSGVADRQPVVSVDGRQVIFVSDRDGSSKIWRVDLDGGNLMRLTDGPDDISPTVSRDNRWVIYAARANDMRSLWRVPIGGGKPVRLTLYLANQPAVSPNGKLIACLYRESSEDSKLELAILPIDGGKDRDHFYLPRGITAPPDLAFPGFRWSLDSRSILYVNTEKSVSNLWRQPVAGGQPKPITNFTSDRIFCFDVSPASGELVYTSGQYLNDGVLITDLTRKKN
jgi:serine/threonine protein kinase/Tol biopolymer transport system component